MDKYKKVTILLAILFFIGAAAISTIMAFVQKKEDEVVENYLIENDCKLQIYYIDKTIDIDDYKYPIKSYLYLFEIL